MFNEITHTAIEVLLIYVRCFVSRTTTGNKTLLSEIGTMITSQFFSFTLEPGTQEQLLYK